VIAVLGGATPLGRLVAAELSARGITAVDHVAPGLDAVIALTGGPAAADAAVAAGVPYVDATASWEDAAEVLERHASAPVPVVPACGFDGLLGDLAASVAAMHFGGPVDEVGVHHDRRGPGAPLPTSPSRHVVFPGGSRWVADSPLVEGVLVPRHVPGAEVITTVAVTEAVGDGFQLVAEAVGFGPKSVVVCEGRNAELLSARFLVTAARAVAQPGQPVGAMAPGEAFDAEPFLDAVAGDELRWSFSFPPPGDLND
jgi:hypothetical protein